MSNIVHFILPKKSKEEELLPFSIAVKFTKQALSDFESDESKLILRIRANLVSNGSQTSSSKNVEKFIRVNDLVHIMMDHKIEFHCLFLERLRLNFKTFEKNNSGFLKISELKNFSNCLSEIIQKDLTEICQSFVDKKCEFVSFSDVVKSLSSNHIIENSQYETALEQIFKSS